MSETPPKQRATPQLDFQGLIFARQFGTDGSFQHVHSVPAALPAGQDGWFWAHLDLVDRRAHRWLAGLGLPPAALQAFTSEDSRPRLERGQGLLYGALAEMQSEPTQQTGRARLLRFAATPGWIITARHHPLEDVDVLRQRLERGLALPHPAAVLAHFVEQSVDRFQREIDAMLASLNWIEDVVIERGGTDSGGSIAEIRRKAVTMHREMSLNKPAVGRLAEFSAAVAPPQDVADAIAADFQKAEALHGELHAIQDRARLLKDEIASNVAMDMNHSLYVLSMISALLLPPSLIFGLFGINVGGLPFLNHDYGFWAVVILGLASSAAVFLMLRRRG